MESQSVAEKYGIKKGEHSITEDRLRSSSISSVSSAKSASSDFSFEDQYQLDINEHGSFALDHEVSSNNGPVTPSSTTSTLQTPPAQVMERHPDTSDYRIPSHIFASNKSGNLNKEWSTASNESLFSIHTGNMSFTRDQFNWLLKSGELGLYGPVDMRKSGELPPPSPKIVVKPGEHNDKHVDLHISGDKMTVIPPDTCKSGEQIIANHFKASPTSQPIVNRPNDVEVISSGKVNEAAIIPDVTTGSKKDNSKLEVKVKKDRSSVSDEVPPSTSVSHHSDASCQSFAFPVLAEIGRDKSVNSGQSRIEQKKSSNTDQEGQKTPTSAALSSSSWFSRFSCCSCC